MDHKDLLEDADLVAEECDSSEPLKPATQRAFRSLALHILYAIDRRENDQPLSEVLQDFRDGFGVEFHDDSFTVQMIRGVLEHSERIDEKIKPLLQHWSFDRLGCCTVLILRMSFWELLFTKTPPQIVINEAVELAKAFAEKDAHRLINGLLDTYCDRAGIKREAPVHQEDSE